MINIFGNAKSYWRDQGFIDNRKFLSVNSCGYQKFITKDFSINRNNGRVDYLLSYIVNGKGLFHINGNTYDITEGNMLIYVPGQPQNYRYSHEYNTEIYWIHFTGHKAASYLKLMNLPSQQPIYLGVDSYIIELFRKTLHELQIKRTFFDEYATAYLMELITYVGRKFKDSDTDNNIHKNKDLKNAIEVMHTEYHRSLSVTELAQASNLSTYRFIHKFKECIGLTPIEYLCNIRIDVAKQLLSSSSLSISEVANMVGYDNPLYFSRVFKQKTGMPPSSYQKSHYK